MRRLTQWMLGTFVAVVAVATVAAQAPPAAPAPVPAPAVAPQPAVAPPAAAATLTDLFPIKVGSKWTYKIGEAQTIEVRVDSAKDGEAVLSTVVGGKSVAKETIKVQADGVYRTKVNDSPINPPVKILALPAKKDTKWLVETKVQEQTVKGNFLVKEEKEKIKLKDGKDIEAVLVESADLDVAGTKTTVKTWFAPGKGMIKLQYSINGNEATLELTEYVEGK